MEEVWIFSGAGGQFPAGAFETKAAAEIFISQHGLTGCLTKYPINIGMYDWVISKGYWAPKREEQRTPEYIQKFSSAYMEHYHYENGAEA